MRTNKKYNLVLGVVLSTLLIVWSHSSLAINSDSPPGRKNKANNNIGSALQNARTNQYQNMIRQLQYVAAPNKTPTQIAPNTLPPVTPANNGSPSENSTGFEPPSINISETINKVKPEKGIYKIIQELNNSESESDNETIQKFLQQDSASPIPSNVIIKKKKPKTQKQPLIKESKPKSNKPSPKRKPRISYKTHTPHQSISKKRYSRQNKHLPKVTYVNEYVQLYFQSAATGERGLLQAMINHFKDTEIRDKDGNTPLIYACMAGNLQSAITLLGAGANPNAKNKDGVSPLYVSTYSSNVDLTSTLINYRASLETTDPNNKTPLMLAAERDALSIVNLLISKGAILNARMINGDTALHLAVKNNAYQSAFSLINAGADIEAVNNKKYTPIMITAFTQHQEMTNLLISAGADINARDARGRDTLTIAKERQAFAIAELIMSENINNQLMIDQLLKKRITNKQHTTTPNPTFKPKTKVITSQIAPLKPKKAKKTPKRKIPKVVLRPELPKYMTTKKSPQERKQPAPPSTQPDDNTKDTKQANEPLPPHINLNDSKQPTALPSADSKSTPNQTQETNTISDEKTITDDITPALAPETTANDVTTPEGISNTPLQETFSDPFIDSDDSFGSPWPESPPIDNYGDTPFPNDDDFFSDVPQPPSINENETQQNIEDNFPSLIDTIDDPINITPGSSDFSDDTQPNILQKPSFPSIPTLPKKTVEPINPNIDNTTTNDNKQPKEQQPAESVLAPAPPSIETPDIEEKSEQKQPAPSTEKPESEDAPLQLQAPIF